MSKVLGILSANGGAIRIVSESGKGMLIRAGFPIEESSNHVCFGN